MSTKWQRLCPANQSDLPPLLFKYHLTSDGYELYMTDLTNVWSEHLSRHQILTRADESAATIDPSEDAEQYQMLLQKIGDAFHNEKDTHVTLDHKSPGTDTLRLTTSTKLPGPLRPLEWTLFLEKEPQSLLAQYMLFPLIKAEAGWESRQQNLMDQLKRKDWILGKLFDKLESVGVDLSTIFPGVSGLRTVRKGATLSQAAKHIRGVAPFDEHAWLDEQNQSSSDTNLAANLLAELFPTSEATAQPESPHPPPDGWWHGLSAASTTALPQRDDVKGIEEPEPPQDGGMTDTASGIDTDDEFERQETPPRFKRSKDTKDKSPDARKLQAPEQDLKASPSPSPRKPPTKRSTGLGKIGGPKPALTQAARSSPSPDHEPTITSEPTRTSPTNNDETDSGSDSDLDGGRPAPSKPTPQPQTTSPAKPRALGLGRIGGQRRQEQKQESPKHSPSGTATPEDDDAKNSHVQSQEKPSAKPRGLGTIGGKKKEPPAPPAKSPEPQQSTDSSPSPPSTKPKPKPTGSKLGVIGGNKVSKNSASSAPASHPPSSSTASRPNPIADADTETEDENYPPANKGQTSKPKSFARKSLSPEEPKHQPRLSEPRASEPPTEPETEEQKADRKREELKRQLQAKAKAPAKKKRKF
ncbi:XLF-domain-containing protein [Aspergillus steynii IBT 23096]|uniref:Non-homologous end-joining factor 1 n=1 Tax=Aspergillus steynii IBT 23096 TaxID=1392250 RepID=A0A2I2FYE2_9EURO|nr:XLF-domain-containing protein [Aspergillus steynii IBT 23096]PLB45647.1 XLF-domain-containing protein [Aspergillus steynii IBT 23096]